MTTPASAILSIIQGHINTLTFSTEAYGRERSGLYPTYFGMEINDNILLSLGSNDGGGPLWGSANYYYSRWSQDGDITNHGPFTFPKVDETIISSIYTNSAHDVPSIPLSTETLRIYIASSAGSWGRFYINKINGRDVLGYDGVVGGVSKYKAGGGGMWFELEWNKFMF